MKIGIDIGGSHIGVGLIDGADIIKMLEKNFTRTDRINIKETIVNETEKMIVQLLLETNIQKEQIECIGIGAPGTIQNGVIVTSNNLEITNFNIAQILEEKFNIPVHIRNDAKCAALAEKEFGSMKEYDDCVFLTIGTGIGGAVFISGKLLEPKRFSGFELGHMVVNKGGRKCSCGKYGCFETYVSIKALKMKVTETLDVDNDINGQYLREELLIKDHPGVKEDVEVFLDYLKTGICNLIDIFEPEIVCLGGSFSYYEGNPVYDRLLEKINEVNATYNKGTRPKITLAELKNNAGIIGATIV